MKIHDLIQGSDAWLLARAGIVTCSELGNIVTDLFKAREGAMPHTYLCKKIAERVMGQPLQWLNGTIGTFSMADQGHMLESSAIPWYEFANDAAVRRVGFITTDDGKLGYSPDGLVGDDGAIEVKSLAIENHIRLLLGGTVPAEYLPQIHGGQLVAALAWTDFVAFSRQLPSICIRVHRCQTTQDKLRAALGPFLDELDRKAERVQALRQIPQNRQTASAQTAP